MDAWKDIVAAAILGTERRPFSPPALGGEIDEILASLGDSSNEDALLSSAAILTSWRAAGVLPESTAQTCFVAEAPPEEKPVCPSVASRILRDALQETPISEVTSLLQIVAGAGAIVPAGLLPELLRMGASSTELRPFIAQTMGQRGAWLAHLRDDWSYILGQTIGHDDSAWEDKLAVRVAYLTEVRRKDPARARELLAGVWKSDPAAARRDLLSTFETGLCTEDEEMLERALDDRSKEVRTAAFGLLAQLPDSSFANRMCERARGAIRFSKGLLKTRFDVEPPEEIDGPAKRDGLDLDHLPRSVQGGQRANALCGVARATPLSLWTVETGCDPRKLLNLSSHSDWKVAIETGWCEAAISQRNCEWALALLEQAATAAQYTDRLLSIISNAQREEWVLRQIEKSIAPQVALLRACPAPWSSDITRAAAKIGFNFLADKQGSKYMDGVALVVLLLERAPVELYAEIDAIVARREPTQGLLPDSVQRSLKIYQYRHDLAKEMNK